MNLRVAFYVGIEFKFDVLHRFRMPLSRSRGGFQRIEAPPERGQS